MKNLNLAFLLSSVLLITSCAQVVPPSGGDKDILPPVVLNANPAQEKTNFDAKLITIEFDEYVQFRNLNEQLLISPPMKNDPNVQIRGRNLLIGIVDTLKENTTYVMNFGNSIVDLNEGNPLGNFTYVFSTGNKVDSLRLNGQVLDAYSLKADKNILLMLYRNFYDSIPIKELPDYVSRSDEEGRFQFSNLRKGTYTIIAVDDKNKDFSYNPVAERIAFMNQKVALDADFTDSLSLFLFEEKNPLTFIFENKVDAGSLLLVFNNPTDSTYLESMPGESIPGHFIERSQNQDSLRIWFNDLSSPLNFRATIKDKKQAIDTINIRIPILKNDSTTSLSQRIPASQNYFQPLKLDFITPIAKLGKKNMKLFKNDSIEVDFKLKHQKNSRLIRLVVEWNEGSPYKLVLLPGAVTDIYGRTNDSITSNFSTNKSDLFSKLMVDVKTEEKSPKIIQLLNEEGKILRQQKLKDNYIVFDHLPASTYRLKLIFDKNNNGKWDTGNYFAKQFPEKAVLFDGKINIRPNWEQELVWKIK